MQMPDTRNDYLPSYWGLRVKRAADFLVAFVLLLLLWPLLLLLMGLVKLTSRGPALFRQQRLGQNGKPFWLLKLRTMVEGAEQMGAGLAIEANDPRITPIGKILRTTSLDELPQLWNVLRGEMSLVGPRPLPVRYLERFNSRQRKRLVMPQGITGWAQIKGRNVVSWPERLEMDVWYVEHWSLGLDVRILVETLWAVFTSRGVAAADGTIKEFHPEDS